MQAEDIEAFIQILRQDPELRRKVFLAILPEEFYALPAKVDKIAQDVEELRRDVAELRAGQEELRAGQEELRAGQEELRAGQEELRAGQEELRAGQEELRAGQEELRRDVAELRAGQEELRRDVAELRAGQEELRTGQEELHKAQKRSETRIARLEDRTGMLLGWQLESRYASRPHSYFGRVLRRVRTMDVNDILEQASAHLSDKELRELNLVDVLITGKLDSPLVADLVVAIEVSNRIDVQDVTRASYRAGLLRKAGIKCIPAVGGTEITNKARSEAERLRVVVILDGGMQGWEQALALLSE